MKKVYLMIAALMAIASCLNAQSITRHLTWNLPGANNWPTVGSTQWTDRANWVISGSSVMPGSGVANGDFLIIPAGATINVTADMSVSIPDIVIEVQGSAIFNIKSKMAFELSAASSAFSISSPVVGSGLTLEKAAGANSTSLALNGKIKALNKGGSTIGAPSTTSLHATGANPQTATTTGFAGFQFGTLPVVLTKFEANLSDGKKVVLSWSTDQEVNSDHFTVEKSSDGIHWQAVATVKAAGNSSFALHYTTSDPTPSTGANFYRIAMVDLDGKTTYTTIKNVRLNALGHISLYPNPATDLLNISLGEAPKADWSLAVINHAGQVVSKYKFDKNTTTAAVPVYRFPAGNYTVEITDGSVKQTNAILVSHR